LFQTAAFVVERSPSGILEAPIAETGCFDDRVTRAYSSAVAAALNHFTQADSRGTAPRYRPVFSPLNGYEPRQLIVTNALRFAMKSFVMAHEIGHAVPGHFGEVIAGAKADTRRVLESPHHQEFAADRFAFEVLLRAEETLRPKYPISVGAICFLTCYLFLLRMRTTLTGVRYDSDAPSESHPARWNAFADWSGLRFPSKIPFIQPFLAMTALFRKLLEVDEQMTIEFQADCSVTVDPKDKKYLSKSHPTTP
jgi:hypothetical protein